MQYKKSFLRDLMYKFAVYGDFLIATPFGMGNVNDTFQVTFDQGGVRLHYILQRINRNVFHNPVGVMENIDRVTSHILKKVRTARMETKKRTLRLLRDYDNKPYVQDENGDYWRAYVFIENARAYEVLETPEQAYRIAMAFGEFQKQLVDLPGGRLNETIPDFHNTPKRFERLEEAVREDVCGRAASVAAEIDFALSLKEEAGTLLRLNESGDIPERITHNDTKSNNILIDDLSGEGVCVLDLDTVMPGLSLYDFGDMVRSATNSAGEDEVDCDKVWMRFDLYEALYKGFLTAADGFMTSAEKENLPLAGKIITTEIGIRFLTDYLEGDTYFKIRRPLHNIERCRNQFKLVRSISEQMPEMMKLLKQ